MQTLQAMSEQDITHSTIKSQFLGKNKKSSHINERWIGWKLIMKEIAALRRSMYSYITSRKQRSHRSVSSNEKQNLKLQTMPR